MTSLRFVGDLPLWIGLVLSFVVAVCSWLYYSREGFGLPRRLKFFLPCLRALAFFLGVMILTGPVLQHRTTIGELGRVKIYLDRSGSMTMQDRHMSIARKLLIAEELGWLESGKIDRSGLDVADALADARTQLSSLWVNDETNADLLDDTNSNSETEGTDAPDPVTTPVGPTADEIESARTAFLTVCDKNSTSLSEDARQQFTADVVEPLKQLQVTEDTTTAIAAIQEIATACEATEIALTKSFDNAIEQVTASGDQSIQTALTMFDDTPRWRRAELGLNESAAKVLQSLREKHEVDVFVLSGDDAQRQTVNEPVESSAGEILPTAEGNETGPSAAVDFATITNLSSGITATQQAAPIAVQDATTDELELSTPPANSAIVLITDGQHNKGPSPIQTARILGSQGVPFYCFSIGATEEAQDLAVLDLDYPDLVFQKDRVRGAMTVRDRMKAGQPFVAEIRNGDEVLWQEQLLTMDIPERRIEFDFAIDDLVEKLNEQLSSDVKLHTLPLNLQASIAPLANESETSNNDMEMRLAAITEGHRLLILDGRSRWETRYLRNAFERDEQWSVNTIIAGASTDIPELPRGDQDGQFPPDRDALFEYDMIVFGEIAPELFEPHEFDWLREFVEVKGGGIVFIDGQRRKLQNLSEQSLATLLPIEWLPDEIATKPNSLQLTESGSRAAALKLKPDVETNKEFWTQLPPPHNLIAVKALPGAEVLVETTVGEQQRPVMVTRNYGAGKVLYLSTDETWRWRYKAADEWHQRVWNQLAKYVMPRPFAVSDEFVSVDTGAVSYDFGDAVDVRVRLMGLDGRPATNATADALLWKDDRLVSTITLNPDPDVPGIYRGKTGGLVQGDYQVSVRASGYSESALKARGQFVVQAPDSGEMSTTSANESLLQQMADASSGRFLREEEMGKLPDLLSPLSNGRVVESTTLLWQSYWWFAAIVILLTIEWILRKRAGLL